MLDILHVVYDLLLRPQIIPAVDLGPSGQAGGHHHAVGKAEDIRLKLPIEIGTLRPGPHKAHVAPQDVPQLGQLIQPGAPEEMAETGAARVADRRPARAVGLRVQAHGPEFIDHEGLSVEAQALLPENGGTGRVQHHDQGNEQHGKRQEQQPQQGAHRVENPLDQVIQPLLPHIGPLNLNNCSGRKLLRQAAGCCCHISTSQH